ncbi:hypothetical protein chiPu_0021944, partial [Chiloscyllium punctatum]|nr:hypothetical protein [Chiloscyllium punctatum]
MSRVYPTFVGVVGGSRIEVGPPWTGLASRTPTLLTIPVSRGQGSSERYRDAGDPPSHSVRHLPLADYTSPLRLIGLNDSHRAPSVTSEPRRPIQ